MLNKLNNFTIFILIFLISVLVSIILILTCEFSTIRTIIPFKQNYRKNAVSKIESRDAMSLEEFKDTIAVDSNIDTIRIDSNITLDLLGGNEIFLPISDIKKDVFIRDDSNLIMLEQGKPYISNCKTKLEAFYYGDSYEIYCRKIK